MPDTSTLAAVDLGSNSFRLQVARVVDDQIYPLDSLREPVRLAAGVGPDKRLDEASQQRALDCLKRFGERLRGLPAESVRAVGTNTLRVAKNAKEFLAKAEAALGVPIEVVAGREEARLIYLGVAHSLPATNQKRMVVDIGGGSTEFIIGSGYRPQKLESLYMGCVTYSMRFFPAGKLSKSNIKQAELAARIELQTIAKDFSAGHWTEAVGSSGTARALADILEANGWSQGGITPQGLERLRSAMLKAGDATRLSFSGLRPDRVPVLPGGVAIMSAIFDELKVTYMTPAEGAMRQGILYDMLGRFHRHDMRDTTVVQFMNRYHVDAGQARRVDVLALSLFRQFARDLRVEDEHLLQLLSWAAKLHEIGLSVAHSGYHKHSAYILSHADMPGFSKMEQDRLSILVLAHRGSLDKMRGLLKGEVERALVVALRLAVLFHRSRTGAHLPPIETHCEGFKYRLKLDVDWLRENPLTAAALREETHEWRKLGVDLEVKSLEVIDADAEATLAG
jgi:exopolyphosphatase/guanosine-5'-triphosphate,3'-diphosphate pyrophosphatase